MPELRLLAVTNDTLRPKLVSANGRGLVFVEHWGGREVRQIISDKYRAEHRFETVEAILVANYVSEACASAVSVMAIHTNERGLSERLYLIEGPMNAIAWVAYQPKPRTIFLV